MGKVVAYTDFGFLKKYCRGFILRQHREINREFGPLGAELSLDDPLSLGPGDAPGSFFTPDTGWPAPVDAEAAPMQRSSHALFLLGTKTASMFTSMSVEPP